MNDFRRILEEVIHDGTCLSLVLSKRRPGSSDTVEKLGVRPVLVRGRFGYQLASRVHGQERHENLSPRQASARILQLFPLVFEHCHLHTHQYDYSARMKPNGQIDVRSSRPTKTASPTVHNRSKNYLISAGVPCPFLIEIGVMTAAGQVRSAKFQKFRQINRFLELVDDVVPNLPQQGTIHVVDFGSGKSYLTFALHHLLCAIHNRTVQIVGLDRNAQVVQKCSQIAKKLECGGLEFRVGDIADYRNDSKVDLAVSLHACDTATDDALAKAVEWQVSVILAVPCCQQELSEKIENSRMQGLLRHGILKERLAALSTDALRALALEIVGYHTQVVEFIDMEHTAKNVLIRAIRRRSDQQRAHEKIESYRNLKELLSLKRIYLEEAFGNDFINLVSGIKPTSR